MVDIMNPFLKEYITKSNTNDYKKALELFYNPTAKCPVCPSENIITSATDTTFIMTCKKCPWKVIIDIPIMSDINVYKSSAIRNRLDALYTMLFSAEGDRKRLFDDGKKVFNTSDSIVKQIDIVLHKQEEDVDKLKSQLYDHFNKLLKIYYKRKELYATVDKDVKNSIIKDLYIVVKNEGYPLSGSRLKEIAIQYKRSEDFLMPWLEWLHENIEYVKQQKEVTDKSDALDVLTTKINAFNESVMIKGEPKVTGIIQPKSSKTKRIKIKIKKKKGRRREVQIKKLGGD